MGPRAVDIGAALTAARIFSAAAAMLCSGQCDKAMPKLQAYHMPTRKEVEEQLFDQQVTAFARRYMRDLRRQADVEYR